MGEADKPEFRDEGSQLRSRTRDLRTAVAATALSAPTQNQMKLGAARPYSVITVDWPEISKRLRQRMFLQAIMSSLRTM